MSTTHAQISSPDFGSATLRVPASVVIRAFPAETVALNLATGTYHGLDPGAGRMLELLARVGCLSTTAQRIAAEARKPAGEVERELREICLALMERGLLEVADARRD